MMTSNSDGRQGYVGVVIHETQNACGGIIAREICNGLEEEQVPYTRVALAGKAADAVEAAYRASDASVFGVGIGISPDSVALHYSRLPADQPLTVVPADAGDHETFRTLGLNAARLIKGKILEEI